MKKLNLLICILILISFSKSQYLSAQYLWEVTEVSNMPERVSNNAVCEGFIAGTPYVYSFGGIDSTKTHSGIHLRSFRCNTVTNTWETIPSLPDDMGKIAAGASRIEDIIYIIGGYHVFPNDAELSSNKVHRYDIINNEYLSDGTQTPSSIDDHVQCVWRDSLIYVITGWSNTGNVPFVQIYNPTDDTWTQGTQVPNNHTYKSFGASGEIIGDTIYYFGGAKSSGSFSIQNNLRKGIIDPNDPTSITWTDDIPDPSINGYRMGATTVGDQFYWIGGSGKTYNFDGIAYSGGQGVEPLFRILGLDETGTTFTPFTDFTNLPMDLRGVANISDTIKYITGGMESNQWVSNKTFKIVARPMIVANSNIDKTFEIKLSPNPANENIAIDLSNISSPISSISLMNNKGQTFIEIQDPNHFLYLETKNFPAGIYIVQIKTSAGFDSKKLLIEH